MKQSKYDKKEVNFQHFLLYSSGAKSRKKLFKYLIANRDLKLYICVCVLYREIAIYIIYDMSDPLLKRLHESKVDSGLSRRRILSA